MDKLKPCPFCGGKAVFDTVSPGAGNTRGFVRCENRCCEMCWVSSKYEAIEAWNRRADTKEIDFDYEAEDGQ